MLSIHSFYAYSLWRSAVCLCALLCAGTAVAGFQVYPTSVSLTGPEARQRLLVHGVAPDGTTATSVLSAEWSSSDPRIVTVEQGVAIPHADGTATLTALVAGEQQQIPVTVQRFAEPFVWSFRNHVQSVLTKSSCNMGACHGAAAGKNGFRLSLRGYDPETDYVAITRQARGRRIVPHDAGRSLLLTKPTGVLPHKGGVRFAEDSLEYRVLGEWLAAGHPAPTAADARITRLEVLPPAVRLTPGEQLNLAVVAHFSDGHSEDVTPWAKYTSTNHAVCQVNDVGQVVVSGHGEGAIVAWYLAQNTTATVTSPYPTNLPAARFASAPRANFIDDQVLAKLESLGIEPSPSASDTDFLRRAYLDTMGVLPTAAEARAFLANPDPAKRSALVDQLFARPEYVDYWSYQWSDVFLLTGSRLRPQALQSFYQWIRKQVQENVGWDQLAREVVLAKGSTFDHGAANFYALHQDPLDMAETVSMAFLGMSINCARCHDHPLEKWTNDDYYGLANLFARVKGKGWGGDFRGGDGNRIIFVDIRGDVIQPRTGRPQAPRPLDGIAQDMTSEGDRREVLATWLTDPSNPYFSRAIVNRVWANYFGVGLVEKVDDLRLTNPASNEVLLTDLATRFAAQGHDLRWLMRQILESQTYQRSHTILPGNAADERFYSRCYPRRLKAEVLLDAVSQVTGVPTQFKDQPAGTRALQLADGSVASYFLDTFGRPERILTCTCERSDEPTMTQVLHLTNGPTLQSKLEAAENRLAKQFQTGTNPALVLDELYLSALARFPTAEERTKLLASFVETPPGERSQLLEDLTWSVLTSREFLFQH